MPNVFYSIWLLIFGIIIFATYGPNQCIADNCYSFSWWEDLLFFSAIFVSLIIIGTYFFKKFVFMKTDNKVLEDE